MEYEIPNYTGEGVAAISRATGNGYDSRVRVVYDASGADLYSLDGRFIMTCPPVVKAALSYAEATGDTMAARRHHRERKDAQLEAVRQCRDQVERIADYLAGNGYSEAVQLGAKKEDINGEYEAYINVSIAEKKAAERKRRSLERQEARRAEREEAASVLSTQERYMNRLRQKAQQFKQQQ